MRTTPRGPDSSAAEGIIDDLRRDVEVLWQYHRVGGALAASDVGIGLGSHDPEVATYTAELHLRGLFPRIVFTGANAPTTVERFPRGEAVHYRELALELGVPDAAILVEDAATNTGQNIEFTRDLLAEHAIRARSVTLISRPYQQRRAYATCRMRWPEVDVRCASRPESFDEHVARIGDPDRVISMLVGDTQRVTRYAELGFAITQPVPDEVRHAYERLVAAGYTSRLLADRTE